MTAYLNAEFKGTYGISIAIPATRAGGMFIGKGLTGIETTFYSAPHIMKE